MLYVYNFQFHWYVVDKFKNAYFKSVSYKKCKDFINASHTTKHVPTIIERLNWKNYYEKAYIQTTRIKTSWGPRK